MYKDEKAEFKTNWYDLWMKQSKEFFDTADKNLKDLFNKSTFPNPEDHLKQIQKWLDALKTQWQFTQLTDQQKMYENYWKMMSKMCSDASDMLVGQWIKRNREQDPIKNTRELYELWLNCCQEVYEKAMHSAAYQKAYGDFMNAALKYWKSAMPK
jgi:hypothetical protein